MRKLLFVASAALIGMQLVSTPLPAAATSGTPQIFDAVIATVNEKPLTLSDLRKRITGQRAVTLEQLSADPEARAAYERMIFEEVLLAEGEAKRVGVSDADTERYLEEVARRNSLSKEGLFKALRAEGKNVDVYRQQVRTEILQSRLANAYMQSAGTVTMEEIQSYLSEHPELTQRGATVKLRRIVISPTGRGSDETQQRAEQALAKLEESKDIALTARAFSDGPESMEGGAIGVIPERDLSPEIFGAILSLKKGEHSGIVQTDQGPQIFYVEDRFSSTASDDPQLLEEVRRRLQEEKFSVKLQSYFAADIFKNHTIERKV